ncbi:MAG: ATP-binding protein [Verrucomicrobiota bacterium]
MEKEYQLSIDPRILELLGPNLYTNIYYVLAELIANAYDADAKNVYIISNKDDISVEDDGHGMSYEAGDVKRYLEVAATSRNSEGDSLTKSGQRRKMGRKGVGKLAALSVSENVDVLTISEGEKSGFVLTRRPEAGNMLRAIDEDSIEFEFIKEHGSAIVMRSPQYRLHKTLDAMRRNLLKIFPLIGSDFRIHVIRGKESLVIEDFDRSIMSDLCALITLGKEFEHLASLVPAWHPKRRNELIVTRNAKEIALEMRDKDGVEHEYLLTIKGWIGTYRTTKGRKAEMTDFPDNFISIFANKKLGEFNILPVVGQNKLIEVFVVGQLHIDLFELTELPDMALSNRQGYKSDDPRYFAMLEYVRKELLADILRQREIYVDLSNVEKKKLKEDLQRENEKKLREQIDKFRSHASQRAAERWAELTGNRDTETLRRIIAESINENNPDLGLKQIVDSEKKRILISQTFSDKSFSDVVYQMLVHNNVPPEDILYTNCDDEVCRVPEGRKVYDYLKEFFVESYSNQKIYVLFITSENSKTSWGAITEVGAAWITQVDHKIFNIHPFRPEHPLDDESQWQNTNRETPPNGDLWMQRLNADIFCQKIEAVCDLLGYSKRNRQKNLNHLGTLVSIRTGC